ncbi:Methionyl-tRNA formyltransferase [Paraconexibacter sp. AEG42_29]|uniref:Methionyl-tRNA formyltransferase n=1 Tax=Paraconexibacter sp. AEG42_29 TaxID=2997339 RepID=A0AAU7AUJ3_9ACTN
MRTVYLGTSSFAAAILEHLAAGDHHPQLVVTRPDRPAGRGRKLTAPPVADAAKALQIDTFQPDDVNAPEARERIAAATPDVLIVCAFGALVKQDLLDAHEILNVHPSLLPRWRGAAPIERAIMAGDDRTGVCIMRLTAGLDSGPVALTETTPIGPADTFGTLAARLEQISGPLLTRALDERPDYAEQVEDGLTYAEKIVAADRTLDPDAGAPAMDRTVRALTPHIGARIDLGEDRGFLGVLEAHPVTAGEGGAHGSVVPQGDRLFYGDLELLRVQPPGGRPMDAADYVRGQANSR